MKIVVTFTDLALSMTNQPLLTEIPIKKGHEKEAIELFTDCSCPNSIEDIAKFNLKIGHIADVSNLADLATTVSAILQDRVGDNLIESLSLELKSPTDSEESYISQEKRDPIEAIIAGILNPNAMESTSDDELPDDLDFLKRIFKDLDVKAYKV